MPPNDLLLYLTAKLLDSKLREVCWVLADNYPEFLTWPAAISFHHAYEGGLITHTCEVAQTALHIAEAFPQAKRDNLLAAALWHDWGKIREYIEVESYAARDGKVRHLVREDPTKAWIYDPKANSHIITSATEFWHVATGVGLAAETTDAITHCILAHHGPVKEWGSPTPPKTLEALILHQADMLSASYGATK